MEALSCFIATPPFAICWTQRISIANALPSYLGLFHAVPSQCLCLCSLPHHFLSNTCLIHNGWKYLPGGAERLSPFSFSTFRSPLSSSITSNNTSYSRPRLPRGHKLTHISVLFFWASSTLTLYTNIAIGAVEVPAGQRQTLSGLRD